MILSGSAVASIGLHAQSLARRGSLRLACPHPHFPTALHRSACTSSSSGDKATMMRPAMILVVMCALDHAAAAEGNASLALVDEDEDYGFSALDGSPMHGRQLRHSCGCHSGRWIKCCAWGRVRGSTS